MIEHIGEFLLKRVVGKAIRSGDVHPTPHLIDFVYGDRDGDLDFDDVTHYVDSVVDTAKEAVGFVADIFGEICDWV